MKRIILAIMFVPAFSYGVSIPTVYGTNEKAKIKELLTALDAKDLNDSIKKVTDLKKEKDTAEELLKLLRSKSVTSAQARIKRLKIRSRKCKDQAAELKKLKSEMESLHKTIETLKEENLSLKNEQYDVYPR